MKMPPYILVPCPMCSSQMRVPITFEGTREVTVTIDRDFIRDHAERCALMHPDAD